MWSKAFWKATLERVLGAVLAVVLAKLGGGDVLGVDLLAVDWKQTASLAAGVAVVTLLVAILAGLSNSGVRGNPQWTDPVLPSRFRRDS